MVYFKILLGCIICSLTQQSILCLGVNYFHKKIILNQNCFLFRIFSINLPLRICHLVTQFSVLVVTVVTEGGFDKLTFLQLPMRLLTP